MARQDLRRGALLMLGATLAFALMSGITKGVVQRLPVAEAMFFRNAAALPVVLAIALRRAKGGAGGGRAARTVALLRTRRFGGHVGRACTGLGAMACGFFPLAVMPLADQIVLSFTAPLCVILLSVPFLGERPSARRWAAVAVGFAGVLVVALGQGAFGGASGTVPAHVWVIAAMQGVFSAVTTLLVRRLSATEASETIVLWQSLLMATALAAVLPIVWVQPSAADLALLLAIGALGGIGQLLQTEAYALAPVSALGPYSYAALIWAMVIGWAAFGDLPGPVMLAGAALVVGAGLAVLPGDLRGGRRAPGGAANAEKKDLERR